MRALSARARATAAARERNDFAAWTPLGGRGLTITAGRAWLLLAETGLATEALPASGDGPGASFSCTCDSDTASTALRGCSSSNAGPVLDGTPLRTR
jgi:hypothetical protein